MSIEEDKQIIEDCLNGDINRYEVIIKKYQAMIINLCFKYTKNYSDAEDVAQEAFLKAFNGLSEFRFESKFSSWLHRIAVNCSLNYINSKEKSKEKETISENICHISEDKMMVETPLSHYNMEKIAEVVQKAYNDLSDELKMMIKLREIDNMSYEDISRKTGISIGTVKSRIHRVRESMLEILNKKV